MTDNRTTCLAVARFLGYDAPDMDALRAIFPCPIEARGASAGVPWLVSNLLCAVDRHAHLRADPKRASFAWQAVNALTVVVLRSAGLNPRAIGGRDVGASVLREIVRGRP